MGTSPDPHPLNPSGLPPQPAAPAAEVQAPEAARSAYSALPLGELRAQLIAHGARARIGKAELTARLTRPCDRAESRRALNLVEVGALRGDQMGPLLRANPHAGLYQVDQDLRAPQGLVDRGMRWERQVRELLRFTPGWRGAAPDLTPELGPVERRRGARKEAHWTLSSVLRALPAPGETALYPSVWAAPSVQGLIPQGWQEPGGDLGVRLEPEEMLLDLLAAHWVDASEIGQTVLARPAEGVPWSGGRSWQERELGPADVGKVLVLTPVEVKNAPRAARTHAAELAWYAAWLLRLANLRRSGAPGPVVVVASSGRVWTSDITAKVRPLLDARAPAAQLVGKLPDVDLRSLGREIAQFVRQPPRPGWALDPARARPSLGCLDCREYRPEQHEARRALLNAPAPRDAEGREQPRPPAPAGTELDVEAALGAGVPQGGGERPRACEGCLSNMVRAGHLGLLPGLSDRHQLWLREQGVGSLSALHGAMHGAAEGGGEVIRKLPRGALTHLTAVMAGEAALRPGVHAQLPFSQLSVGIWVAVRRGQDGGVQSALLTLVPRAAARSKIDRATLARLAPVQIALRGPGLSRLPRLMALVMARWIGVLAERLQGQDHLVDQLQPQLLVWDAAQAGELRQLLMASVLGQHDGADQRALMARMAEFDVLVMSREAGGAAASAWLSSLLWGSAAPGDVQKVSRWLEVQAEARRRGKKSGKKGGKKAAGAALPDGDAGAPEGEALDESALVGAAAMNEDEDVGLPFPAGPSPVRVLQVLPLIEAAAALPVLIARTPRPVSRALWRLQQLRQERRGDELLGARWEAAPLRHAPESALADSRLLAAATLEDARDVPDLPPGRELQQQMTQEHAQAVDARLASGALGSVVDALPAQDDDGWATQVAYVQRLVEHDPAMDALLGLSPQEPADRLATLEDRIRHRKEADLARLRGSDRLQAAIEILVWDGEYDPLYAPEVQERAHEVLREVGLSEDDRTVLGKVAARLAQNPRHPGFSLYMRPEKVDKYGAVDAYGGVMVRRYRLDHYARLPGSDAELALSERQIDRSGFSDFGRGLGELQLRAQAVCSAGEALSELLRAADMERGLMQPLGRSQAIEAGGRAVPLRTPRPHPGPAGLIRPQGEVGAPELQADPRTEWIQDPLQLAELLYAPDVAEPAPDGPEAARLREQARVARLDLYASTSWRYLEGLEEGARAARLQELPVDDVIASGQGTPAGLCPLPVLDILELSASPDSARSRQLRAQAEQAGLSLPQLSPLMVQWLQGVQGRLQEGDLLALQPRELPAWKGEHGAGKLPPAPGLRDGDIGMLWSPQAAPGFLAWPLPWHGLPETKRDDATVGGEVGKAFRHWFPGADKWRAALGRYPGLKLRVQMTRRESPDPEAQTRGGAVMYRDWMVLRPAQPQGGRAWMEILRASGIAQQRREIEGVAGLLPGALIPSLEDFGWSAIDSGVRALQNRPVSQWPLFLQDPVTASTQIINDPLPEALRFGAKEISASPDGRTQEPLGPQRAVITGSLRHALTLCWGPPGTGKSHTISQSVLATILDAARRARHEGEPLRLRVLLCAPTYEATNELLRKVSEVLPAFLATRGQEINAPVRLWRLAAETRRLKPAEVSEIEDALLGRGRGRTPLDPATWPHGPLRLIQVERNAPDAGTQQGAEVALQKLWSGQSATLRRWNDQDLELARTPEHAQAVLTRLADMPLDELQPGIEIVFAGGQQARRLHDHEGDAHLLVIDEASQVDLPVAALMCAAAGPKTRVLVSGDHRQLAPVRPLPDPDPRRRSLMDWLLKRDAPKIQLDTSFRSAQVIVDAWKNFGYMQGGSVATAPELTARLHAQIDGARDYDDDTAWLVDPPEGLEDLLSRPGVHIVTQALSALQLTELEQRGSAPGLMDEAALSRDLLHAVINKRGTRALWPTDRAGKPAVAVVLPRRADVTAAAAYADQSGLIERDAEVQPGAGAQAVRIDTVDRFQGQEAQMVLNAPLPLTLADAHSPLGETQAFSLEPRRLCVAFSRARRSLVIALPAAFQHRGALRLPSHGSRGDDHTRLGYEVLERLVRELQSEADPVQLPLQGREHRSTWRVWSRLERPAQAAVAEAEAF